uniref:Glycolipid transfer protein domain containing 2b n=1 Tax=Electrophorus electricus TaxID=8005 RepID=A0A4W4FNL8_ELEEL
MSIAPLEIYLLRKLVTYGALDQQWQYCLKVYIHHTTSNSSPFFCQKFQAGDLLKHLQAAPVLANDVLLKPYLASWDELIKFLKTLGPIMGLVSQEIESKTSIIRKLAQKEEEDIKRLLRERQSEAGQVSAEGGAYVSVRSMMEAELARGLVDFTQLTVSGCRTLLRLHRALLWLQLFLQSLADEDEGGCSPAQLCRDTYRLTLAQHHTFWVKQAAELAFKAMPERAFFHRLVCAKTPVETVIILHMVSGAIGEVYNRTQLALEEHGMLALP